MSVQIRNFCILAHVDHGKSTLCDRFLELTGTVKPSEMKPQYLDVNPISRERGITIKLAPVRMVYKYQISNIKNQNDNLKCKNNQSTINNQQSTINHLTIQPSSHQYIFNLIDTPGHVDFSYEVSRSLAACEGAILLVDATQGIQAQTLAYFEKAKRQHLIFIPVINKIDLPLAQPEDTAMVMVKTFGFKEDELLFVSAKTGEGVEALLKAIIKKIPPPAGDPNQPLRTLVFDSFYDQHKGVIVKARVVDGEIKKGERLQFMASKADFVPIEIGYFQPHPVVSTAIENGAVGYIATGLKDISLARVGDTITEIKNEKLKIIVPLSGYQPPKPMVFVGVYPVEQDDFSELQDALGKLRLNDASFNYIPESSLALGKGFRMGFLGPLHAEVVGQRLEREFGLELITTVPNVEYEIKIKKKDSFGMQISKIKNISEIPHDYEQILEPLVKGTILTPAEYLGKIMKLCQEHRGRQLNIEYLDRQVKLEYGLPLSEIIVDFFSQLKSVSSGYASFDYQFLGYQPFEGARLDIYIAGKMVDALSQIVPKDKAYQLGRELVERLFRVIPKQMFEFAIQAAIGRRIIASATKSAWRKDVTAKLYGGDQTRKDKLLKKQKKGKKRMKAVGRVYIPQEAFLAVLRRI